MLLLQMMYRQQEKKKVHLAVFSSYPEPIHAFRNMNEMMYVHMGTCLEQYSCEIFIFSEFKTTSRICLNYHIVYGFV